MYVILQTQYIEMLLDFFTFAFLDNGWLFAHEVGHCIGGEHLRRKGVFELKTIFTLFNNSLHPYLILVS